MLLEPQDVVSFNGPGPWYLMTPYSKWAGKSGLMQKGSWEALDDASREAALITIRLQNSGLVVYSPIVHSHQLCVADKAEAKPSLDRLSHDYWLAIDKVHMAKGPGGILAGMDGWRESKGIQQELDWYASEFSDKPVYFLDTDTFTLQSFP